MTVTDWIEWAIAGGAACAIIAIQHKTGRRRVIKYGDRRW